MKNKKTLLITSLALTAILSGCGTTTSSSSISQSSNSVSSSESSVEQSYNINIASNDDATISVDKQTAKKGETIIITINVTNEKKFIKEVKANTENATKIDETHYSFIMGEKDVVISVTLENRPLENHSITVNSDENIVSYVLKVNDQEVTEAKEGEVVTLQATLNNKYILSSVTSEDGLTFSEIVDNSVTFTMLDKPVTISMSSLYVSQKYKINSFYATSPIISSISGVEVGEEILEGSQKTIEVFVNKSYSQYLDFKFDVNYQTYSLTLNEEKSTTEESVYTGNFTMPGDSDSSIVVYPAMKESTASGSIKVNIEADESMVKVLGVENGKTYSKTAHDFTSYISTSYLVYNIMPKDGYYFNYSSDIKVQTSSEGSASLDKTSNLYYSYISSSLKEVTIKITAHKLENKNKIIVNNSENFEVVGGLTQLYSPGTPVCLSYKSTNGYLINGKPEISSLTSGKYFYSNDVYFNDGNTALYFVMPECDVQFTFAIEIPTTLVVADDNLDLIKSYYFASDTSGKNQITNGFVDSTIYLFAEPIDGYYIESVTMNDAKMSEFTKYYSGKIEKKRSNTNKIVFNVKKYINITYDNSDAYTFSINKTYAKIGETVIATIKEKLCYQIKKVSLVKIDDSAVSTELSSYNGYSYSFSALDYDVKIVVEYEIVNSYTLSFTKISGISSLSVYDKYENKLNSGDLVNEGSKISLSLTLEKGYSVNSIKINDEVIEKNSSGKYVFNMPSSNSTINFDLHEAQKYNINFDFGGEDITTKIVDKTLYPNSYGVVETTDGKALEGNTINIDFTANNYYKEMDLSNITITTASEKVITPISKTNVSIKFTMPSEDITIKCDTKESSLLKSAYLDDNASSYLTIVDTIYNETITSKFISGNTLKATLNATADLENYNYKLVIYDKPESDSTRTSLLEFKFDTNNTYKSFNYYKDIYIMLEISAK